MMEVGGQLQMDGYRKFGEQRFWISVGGNQGFLLVTGVFSDVVLKEVAGASVHGWCDPAQSPHQKWVITKD